MGAPTLLAEAFLASGWAAGIMVCMQYAEIKNQPRAWGLLFAICGPLGLPLMHFLPTRPSSP